MKKTGTGHQSTRTAQRGDDDLTLAKESLTRLLEDQRVPGSVRRTLKEEYSGLAEMLNRLENQHLHIVAFGHVGAGKSSLLNALAGKPLFSVSVLHGETTVTQKTPWLEREADGVFLIDTPGINEAMGEARETLALEAAAQADLVLFVADSDLTETELRALRSLAASARPVLLVINKADQYTASERETLLAAVRQRVSGRISAENILFAAASPAPQTVLTIDSEGKERETRRQRPPDVAALKTRLWEIIETEGKTLAALNASLFASDISNRLGEKIIAARQQIGEKTIHMYCIAKGVAVALNPLPIADLIAAAAIDVGMIVHLSRIYGLPMTRSEASELVRRIAGQMLALYSSFWVIHFASSALKLSTAGLSTLATGVTQGAIAWYSTLVVGEAAKTYLARGKSWGEAGPKLVIRKILDDLDRDSIIQGARAEIRRALKA